MNWTSILSQIFFCMLVTSITGSVMLVIWSFCCLFLQKWNPNLIYYMLRWVVFLFLLPITYVAITLNYEAGYVSEHDGIQKMMFLLKPNSIAFFWIAVVWTIAIVIAGAFLLRSELSQYRLCKFNFEDGDSLAQSEFECIKEVLGIKGSVELLRNDSPRTISPFVYGLWKRKVVLPYLDYTPEELKVILYHELSHIKKRDILFRYLAMMALALNSINPFAYLLLWEVIGWSEADCDARAIEALEKEGIYKKQYFDIIWGMMDEDPNKRSLFAFPMLHGKRNIMYRRVEFMENYRKNMTKYTKPLTFALVFVFALFSGVTAYGAGLQIAEAGDDMLKDTQQVVLDEEFVNTDGWSEEMYIESSNVPDIVYVNDGIMMLGEGSISWDVPVGKRYVTSSIYMTEGTIVSIACTARPMDCTYWFGLMYANTDCNVVEGCGSGSHDFTVPSSGYYRIMVENRSSQQIHVTGTYQY